MNGRQRILLLVEAEPGWPGTVESRIKRAYKCLLRSFGVRIKDHREVPAGKQLVDLLAERPAGQDATTH